MSEGGEIDFATSKDHYLNSIGKKNAQAVTAISDTLQAVLTKEGTKGFLLAVGGTVTKPNPESRKDIDLRLGIKFGDAIIEGSLYDKAVQRYKLYKPYIEELRRILDPSIRIEEDEPHKDRDFPSIQSNDGVFKLYWGDNKPIEILTDQEGIIPQPVIELFRTA